MDPAGTGVAQAQAAAAARELARQLHEYLDKLEVIPGLQDPRPDLFLSSRSWF